MSNIQGLQEMLNLDRLQEMRRLAEAELASGPLSREREWELREALAYLESVIDRQKAKAVAASWKPVVVRMPRWWPFGR